MCVTSVLVIPGRSSPDMMIMLLLSHAMCHEMPGGFHLLHGTVFDAEGKE